MNFFSRSALALSALMAISVSAAQATPSDATHELSGGTSAIYYKSGTSDLFVLQAEYGYFMNELLEPSVSVTYQNSNGSTASTLLVGPVFNFGDIDPMNAIFAGAKIGFGRIGFSSGGSATGFLWSIEAGKRFPITPRISWKPEISYLDGSDVGNGVTQFVPLQFSFAF